MKLPKRDTLAHGLERVAGRFVHRLRGGRSGETLRARRRGWLELPAREDPAVEDACGIIAQLGDNECREFVISVSRAVIAYERSSDCRYLEQLAGQVRVALRMHGDAEYRRELHNAPTRAASTEEAVDVDDLLAKLNA